MAEFQEVPNRFQPFAKPPRMQVKERRYSTVGKTAAMILNELYPDFKEQCNYETLQTPTKTPRFKCSFVVSGNNYEAEGSSKKIAKQLACEAAIKDLRPDLTIEGPSFVKAEEEKLNAANARAVAEQSEKASKPTKRKMADAAKISNSLHDYFLRLCREKEIGSNEEYHPVFNFTEVPSASDKPNIKRFLCTLTLANQGKQYSHECSSKVAGKNCVIRSALLELFNVKHEELKTVERRSLCLRPGNPVQVLLQALSFYDRCVQIDVDTADEKPVEAGSRFVAKIILDNEKTIVGPVEESKQKARDAACVKVLHEELELSMPTETNIAVKRAAAVLSPCYALHALMIKQTNTPHPEITYSDAVDISEGPGKPPLFKCQVTLNKKDTFEGIGQSKKAAKSAAAEKALTEFFKFDMLAENAMDVLGTKRMKVDECIDLCADICMLVRTEYETICHQQGCPLTTHIAAFVIITPDGERRMVSLGAGRNSVIDGRFLKTSQGALLVHMQGAVLARRGFLLYLHKQLEKADEPDSMFEKNELSGKYRFKPGYKVVLYSTFPPNTTRIGSEQQKLCCYVGNGGHLDLTPETTQTYEEMTNGGCVNIMSIADKMLKWNCLGVQGALLSYIVEPIFISHYFIAVPSNDRVVMNAVLLRFDDSRKNDFIVRAAHNAVMPQGEMYHNWVAGLGMLERLDPYTGRTVAGAPSRLSKTELFESWSRLLTVIGGVEKKLAWTCSEAKNAEGLYMSALNSFYEQLKKLGLGTWQRKNRVIDEFTLVSFDE